MHKGSHLFHSIKPIAAIDSAVYTASKTDAAVLDLNIHGQGMKAGLIVSVNAATTLDGSNLFTAEIWESDSSPTATTLGTDAAAASDTDRMDHDVLGLVENGVLLTSDDVSTFPYPLLNATSQAGNVYFLAYRGYKRYLQARLLATGSPSATISAVWVLANGDTVNHLPEVQSV